MFAPPAYIVMMDPRDQFRQYRKLLTGQAERALESTGTSGSPPSALSAFAPAARLLLRDSRADHAALASLLQHLAAVGRPWSTIGVNVGTLAAPVDDAIASAARAALHRYLHRHATQLDHALGVPSIPPVRSTGGTVMHFPPMLFDSGGQSRDEYHALAVHLCLAAFQRRYESLPPDVWASCEQAVLDAVAPLRIVESFHNAPPPPLVPLVLWSALGLMQAAKLLSRDVDLEFADAAVQAIVAAPGSRGSLHPMHDNESLDVWTYRELVGLHALANMALLRRNALWAARVNEVAGYHLEHTQPDNATTLPWAVFAFLWSPRTRSFAEQQMHDATVQGDSVLSAMLLADAADALSEFA